MRKFVPYEKLSKRARRGEDRRRRGDWGLVNPATRRVESAKVYKRERRRSSDFGGADALLPRARSESACA